MGLLTHRYAHRRITYAEVPRGSHGEIHLGMHVGMHIGTQVRTGTHIGVHIHRHTLVCNVHGYANMLTGTHEHRFTGIYRYTRVYVCKGTLIHRVTHMNRYIGTHTGIHIHRYTSSTHIHMGCMYTCTHRYAYLQVHGCLYS